MIVFYGIYFVSFIRSFRLGFGIVSTVWYVFVYNLYVYLFSGRRNIECKYQEGNFDIVVLFMVFNATYNNISAISWRSVLLMGETGIPGENHPPVVKSLTHLSHNVESSTSRHERDSNSQHKCCFCVSLFPTNMATSSPFRYEVGSTYT
jgi:hypothetical protein